MTTVTADADFATWVAQRRPAPLRAAWAITRDPSVAEDVLHSALASVLPRWGTLRDHRAADAYVRRAMVNQYRSWCRRAQHRCERSVPELPDRPTPDPDPGEAVDAAARGRELWALVLTLPRAQRSAVVLRYYEGLSEADTARALGVGIGTVKSSTSRGLATLRLRAEVAGLDHVG